MQKLLKKIIDRKKRVLDKYMQRSCKKHKLLHRFDKKWIGQPQNLKMTKEVTKQNLVKIFLSVLLEQVSENTTKGISNQKSTSYIVLHAVLIGLGDSLD